MKLIVKNSLLGGESVIGKVIRGLASLIGITVGVALYFYVLRFFPGLVKDSQVYQILGAAISGIIMGFIFFIVSPWIIKEGKDMANWVEGEMSKLPPMEIIMGSIGLIIGLVIAYLISQLIMQISVPIIGTTISVALYIFLGYVGMNLGRRIVNKNTEEIFNLAGVLSRLSNPKEKDSKEKSCGEFEAMPKVLDTSVIIDGRILDICKTGFIEGKLIVPTYVLEELRHIADSSDDLKRVRGRRGLDILNALQKEEDIEVEIYEKDFEDIAEVDSKLLKLTEVLGGKVVTNDYNLNKVAQFQGVKVLNINELANAVKPVAIPGERMTVQIVKEGKESGQGVAYLDDGTMIVVEGGKKYMTKTITVLVTSVLQTAAGRMIFAKPGE